MKLKRGKSTLKQSPGAWLGLCILLQLTCLFLFVKSLRSQQKPDIAVESKLVNVLATVRNKKGEIVRNLTKDDFVLQEDGRPQTIQYFAQESNLPLTLGLLVDTSGSQRRVLGDERTASYAFLDHVLSVDKDKAFILHFDHEVELLQDLTSSRQKLEASLQLLQTPDDNNSGGGPRSHGGGGGGRTGGGTLLYDAVYLASNDLMKKQTGRKAVIILSDGVDHGSKESLVDAIESAQRADTLVYSILFADDEGYARPGGFGGGMGGPMGGGRGGGGHGRYPQESRTDGKKVLEQISKETGARLFEVSKKLPIDQIYAQIEDELRNQYSLGYTPSADAAAGYRKIQLTTKQKDLIVQARDGYYVDH
jgi:VWFA-related protein